MKPKKNFENLWKSYPIRENVLSSRLRFHMISWKNQNSYVRVYFLTLKKTLRIWHDREPLRKTITPYLLGLHDVSLSKEYYLKFALLNILIAFEKHQLQYAWLDYLTIPFRERNALWVCSVTANCSSSLLYELFCPWCALYRNV